MMIMTRRVGELDKRGFDSSSVKVKRIKNFNTNQAQPPQSPAIGQSQARRRY